MESYRNIEQIEETYRNTLPAPEGRGEVQRAELFITEHLFDSTLVVGKMEEQCHIYGKSFASQFDIVTGFTPKAFILHHRIEAAKLLLLQTEASVTTIALSLGFSSLSSFDKAFEALVGQRPSEWRSGSKGKKGSL
jgi:AraC-like DNA-binding protein